MGQEASKTHGKDADEHESAIVRRFEKLGCDVDVLARNCDEHFQIAAAFVEMYTRTCAGELDPRVYRERLGNESLVVELVRMCSDIWRLSRETEFSSDPRAFVLYAPARDARATGDDMIEVAFGSGDDVFGLLWPGLFAKRLTPGAEILQKGHCAARVIAYAKDSGMLPLALFQSVRDCPVLASDLAATDATASVIDRWNAFMALPYSDAEYRVKNKRHTLVFDSGFVQRLLQCASLEVMRAALQDEFTPYEGFYFGHILYLAFPVRIASGKWRLIIADLRREKLSLTDTSAAGAHDYIAVVRIVVEHFLTYVAPPEARGTSANLWGLTLVNTQKADLAQSGTNLILHLTAFVTSSSDPSVSLTEGSAGAPLKFVHEVVSRTGGVRADAVGRQEQSGGPSSGSALFPLATGTGSQPLLPAATAGQWADFHLDSAAGAHIKTRPPPTTPAKPPLSEKPATPSRLRFQRKDDNSGMLIDVLAASPSAHEMLKCGMVCDYGNGLFDQTSIIQAVRQDSGHAPDQFLSVVQGYIQRANSVISRVKTIPAAQDRAYYKQPGNKAPTSALFDVNKVAELTVNPDKYTIAGGSVVVTGLPILDGNRMSPKRNTDVIDDYDVGALRRLNFSYHGLVAPNLNDDRFVMLGILDASRGIATHKNEKCTDENYGEIGFHELRWARQYVHDVDGVTSISSDHGVFYCPETPTKTEYMLTAMADPVERRVWIQLTLILDGATSEQLSFVHRKLETTRKPRDWVSTLVNTFRRSQSMHQFPTHLKRITDYLYTMFGVADEYEQGRAFARLEEVKSSYVRDGDEDDASSNSSRLSMSKLRTRLIKRNRNGVARSARIMLTLSDEEAKVLAQREERLAAAARKEREKRIRQFGAEDDDDEDDYRDDFVSGKREADSVTDTYESVKQRYAETSVWVKHFLPVVEGEMLAAQSNADFLRATKTERVRMQPLKALSQDVDDMFLALCFLKNVEKISGFQAAQDDHKGYTTRELPRWDQRVEKLRKSRDKLFREEAKTPAAAASRGTEQKMPGTGLDNNNAKLELAQKTCNEILRKIESGDTSTALLVAMAKNEEIARDVIDAYEAELAGDNVSSDQIRIIGEQLQKANQVADAIHAAALRTENPTSHTVTDNISLIKAERDAIEALYGDYEAIRDAESIRVAGQRLHRVDELSAFLILRYEMLKKRITALMTRERNRELETLLSDVSKRQPGGGAVQFEKHRSDEDGSRLTMYQSFMSFADEARKAILRVKKGTDTRMEKTLDDLEKKALQDKVARRIKQSTASKNTGTLVLGNVPDEFTEDLLMTYLTTTLHEGTLKENGDRILDRRLKEFHVDILNCDSVAQMDKTVITIKRIKV